MTLHDLGFLGQGHYAHGTRQNYLSGCHCLPCRAANAAYEQQRARARAKGLPAWVSAEPARRKLLSLARIGIGHRQAAKLAHVSVLTVQRIRTGHQPRIRLQTERAILAIERPALAKGVDVNGYETRHYVESLKREAFAESWLAQRLGLRSGRLRLGTRVKASTALRVRALYQQLIAE